MAVTKLAECFEHAEYSLFEHSFYCKSHFKSDRPSWVIDEGYGMITALH
jgi:hypothetical protein